MSDTGRDFSKMPQRSNLKVPSFYLIYYQLSSIAISGIQSKQVKRIILDNTERFYEFSVFYYILYIYYKLVSAFTMAREIWVQSQVKSYQRLKNDT